MIYKIINKKSFFETTVIFGLITVLAAQFKMNLFLNNFKISIGIITFPVFLFLIEDFPILSVSIFSSIGVFITRIAFPWLQYGFHKENVLDCLPESFFYLAYGFLIYLYSRKKKDILSNDSDIIWFIFMDYLANLVELILRFGLNTFKFDSQLCIIVVAISRSFIIWALITFLKKYHLTFMKEEHAHRYRKLMLLISKLNGEVIWMKKNTALIEETMNSSYKLFNDMKNQGIDEEISKEALNVAKDIHEIKKEYILILRGISEAMDLNLENDGMYISDIVSLLESSASDEAFNSSKKVIFNNNYNGKLYTDKEYFFMSIFRNIFTNAVEASVDNNIIIDFSIVSKKECNKDFYSIIISDNGPGIDPEDIDEIFEPGFSTKINFETGEVNRGLGLNLVKDIVENQFNGKINVISKPGNTSFIIDIPKNELKVI
ncbi:ATP-binding protein [Peptacetobacter sp.]|uniref:ATP-binding protein n=1 Tax=Peptacetobacter sp. TaxID=2991975 RepID=UPI0026133310|nr:sensor histidine kinase [Peptacetobacter sp.]